MYFLAKAHVCHTKDFFRTRLHLEQGGLGSVRLRFMHGTIRVVPVFGFDGSSGKGFFSVSILFNRMRRFWFRFRFLKIVSNCSGSFCGFWKKRFRRFRFGSSAILLECKSGENRVKMDVGESVVIWGSLATEVCKGSWRETLWRSQFRTPWLSSYNVPLLTTFFSSHLPENPVSRHT